MQELGNTTLTMSPSPSMEKCPLLCMLQQRKHALVISTSCTLLNCFFDRQHKRLPSVSASVKSTSKEFILTSERLIFQAMTTLARPSPDHLCGTFWQTPQPEKATQSHESAPQTSAVNSKDGTRHGQFRLCAKSGTHGHPWTTMNLFTRNSLDFLLVLSQPSPWHWYWRCTTRKIPEIRNETFVWETNTCKTWSGLQHFYCVCSNERFKTHKM